MLNLGMFVELPGGKGLGKLEAVSGLISTVTVFRSIRNVETREVELLQLKRGYLSPHTRVYVRGHGRTRVGRVIGFSQSANGYIDYEIQFPNGKAEDLSERALQVRPWNAPEDPAEMLAIGASETQFLHDRRQDAMGALLKLRSASQGLTSVPSASVDYVAHQVAAVKRVLSDPIQRYLLADEVGLGKTIEAGLIIRQHLIDNPETRVLVCVPDHLVGQWHRELVDKIRLDQFAKGFECCGHADLAQVLQAPDILVIDEAHHLVGIDAGPLQPAADRLRILSREVPVLLLLSATPALGEEARFLALLNLLDPINHPIEDLSGFKVKLEQRREIGRLLLSLSPDGPRIVLRQRGAELMRLFPSDEIVQEFAPQLIEAAKDPSNDLTHLCSVLKDHIANSYRIHQRLIRSRRVDAAGWEFVARGPITEGEPLLSHVKVEEDPADIASALLTTLEDWRFSAAESSFSDDGGTERFALRYRDLLGAVSEGADALRKWLKDAEPIFDGEDELLAALGAIAEKQDDRARIETMVESTTRLIKAIKPDEQFPKVVVFASSERVARHFHDVFQTDGDGTTAYLLTSDSADVDKIALDFSGRSTSSILVTDRSGEEGLNLSFADAIVHLDLPMAVARVEQRIGRLDRFGRRKNSIRHRLLLPSEEDVSPWRAWFEMVADGFMAFNRSTSDIQFLLERLEVRVFETLLQHGPDALKAMTGDFRSQIAEERKSQDEQYALDRITLAEERVETFIEALEDAEEDEEALERAVDGWLVETLQIRKQPFKWPEDDPFKLVTTKHTLIPRVPWQSELHIDHSTALTWRRRVVTNRHEANLLRPGMPLLDSLERFTQWDDRGTAFATYRVVPDWNDEIWIGFKLCFVVEPQIEFNDFLAPSRSDLALWRHAQRYLAPTAHTVYIDLNGVAVTNPELIAIISRRYSDRPVDGFPKDINLGSRPQLLADIIDPSAFQTICLSNRDAARERLSLTDEIASAVARAVTMAETDLGRHERRMTRGTSSDGASASAESDIDAMKSILQSIRQPSIRLDAMGCFIVAQHAPKRPANE
jgi:ATP-dependent helicase HepA